MADKGYIFRVLKNASFGKMKKAIKDVHERSGKNSVGIFFDMLWCAKRYGAGYYDYEIFAFYNLNKEQRKTFVTRLISKKLNMFMNDTEYAHLLTTRTSLTSFSRIISAEDTSRWTSHQKRMSKNLLNQGNTFSAKCRTRSAVSAVKDLR